MSLRNLDHLFRPQSLALIGASARPGTAGHTLMRNLLTGAAGRPTWLVNPKHAQIEGVPAYASVDALPAAPELAVIATPAATVPGLIAQLGARGTRAAIVISAGFGESVSGHGLLLQQQMLDAAKPQLLRIIGPNCIGVSVPGIGLEANFLHLHPHAGRLAFLSQSGAVLASVVDWAHPRGIGFSHLVSLGDMADVDFGDLLDYMANDPATDAILLYVESITHARKFMSAARAAARRKPVIAIKAGRHAQSAQAAASHTGALAGVDAVYDAVFRRAGIVRVDDLEALFDVAAVLAMRCLPTSDRLTIVTNGGGMGVMASDKLLSRGGRLHPLTENSLHALDAVLPPTWSHANPVDLIGDADAARYTAALDALVAQPDPGCLLVLNCPTGVSSSLDAARAVVDFHRRQPGIALLTSWIGEQTAREARQLLTQAGIPSYATPERAVDVFTHLDAYRVSQLQLAETPPSIADAFTPDIESARRIVAAAVGAGQRWLDNDEVKRLLEAYAIPTLRGRVVPDAVSAAACMREWNCPVALKIQSPDIPHKSDVGGVALNLATPDAVREMAGHMLEHVARQRPQARIDGLLVEPMATPRHARELIVGAIDDAGFGPVMLFGHGGTAVELIDDKALALPPLNLNLARDLIDRTRIARQLRAYRDQAAVDLDAVALALIKLSQLVADLPQVREIEINPLIAHPGGILALDARCRVEAAGDLATDRLAIPPYPRELEQTVALEDGTRLDLRPIRPEDEPALQALFLTLSQDEIRLRFFTYMRELPHRYAARLTQIDYDREIALVASPAGGAIVAVVRLFADPDNEHAEFAILVHHAYAGRGLGKRMMQRLIELARQRGIQDLHGDVLADNAPMLGLCRGLGFELHRTLDRGVIQARLTLSTAHSEEPTPP